MAYGCRPGYVQGHVRIHTIRAGRLFGGGQKQGPASEPVEVGDLSRWEIKRSGAVNGIFSDNGGGQQGWKRGTRPAIQEASHSG